MMKAAEKLPDKTYNKLIAEITANNEFQQRTKNKSEQ